MVRPAGTSPRGDSQAARTAVDFLHRSGTTTLLASLVTASREDLLRALASSQAARRRGLIAGIHSEGPFLSHARCGAQDPAVPARPRRRTARRACWRRPADT